MIEAVIFDLDGLIIDSEPYWKLAEIKAFAEVGLELNDTLCRQTTGLSCIDVVHHWYQVKSWEGISMKKMADTIESYFLDFLRERPQPMPGVLAALESFKQKNIPLAVASSSVLTIIEESLRMLNIRQYFKTIHSSEFEEYSKPHPAVYISTCKKLQVDPRNVLAFEDTFYGTLAAKAAKIKVVAVPSSNDFSDPRFCIADRTLASLADFNQSIFQELDY